MHPFEKLFSDSNRPCGPRVNAEPATKTYAMIFTPRSGSSLFTELCKRTEVLGNPGEIFRPNSMYNPETGRGNFRHVPSDTVEAYVDGMSRKRKSKAGVFGLQATPFQIKPLLENGQWWELFPSASYCILTRKDIVSQAVSLYLKKVSGFGHSISEGAETKRSLYDAAPYDGAGVYRWIRHVFNMEYMIENYFAGEKPLRIEYESFVSDKIGTLERLARHIGVSLEEAPDVESTAHKKLGGERNQEWAQRFRRENEELVKRIEASRGTVRIQTVERSSPMLVSRFLCSG